MRLVSSQYLRGGKVFQVFVVSDNIDQSRRAFKVVASDVECFENSQKFLIVGVVVQLQCSECPGVEHDRMDLAIIKGDGEYSSDGVVRGISFHCDRDIRNEMHEDWSHSEGVFKGIKRPVTFLREVPRSTFTS